MTPPIALIERIRDANNDLLTIFRSLSPALQQEFALRVQNIISHGLELVKDMNNSKLLPRHGDVVIDNREAPDWNNIQLEGRKQSRCIVIFKEDLMKQLQSSEIF